MNSKNLRVIFWNTWYQTQNGVVSDGKEVADKIEEICHRYKPDVIGLNEVDVSEDEDQEVQVIKRLKKDGLQS